MTGRCRILVNAVVRASEPLPVSCWGAGRHPKGRNVVEQPRTARLDAAVGGAAPHGDVIHHVPALTFHSRSSRPHPPLKDLGAFGSSYSYRCVCVVAAMFGSPRTPDRARRTREARHMRGVGAGRSAQRGTSAAT